MTSGTPMTQPRAASESNALSTVAIVLGAVAVFIAPIILGPIAIVVAAFAKRRGERLSTTALVVAIAGMIVGFILGAIVYNSMVK